MSHIVLSYINDVNIKDLKARYKNKEISELSKI